MSKVYVLLLCLALLMACNPYEGVFPMATASPTATKTATARADVSLPFTLTPAPQTCTVQTGVPAGSLNIRTGPGMQYAVIGLLHEGETLTVITRGAWLEVETADRATGFVNSKYCK